MDNYFKDSEFFSSATAKLHNIDNSYNADVYRNWQYLRDVTLNPLREAFRRPIRINSGYRCPELNKLVGGASQSNHLYGNAADITAGSVVLNKQLFCILINNHIPFTRCIIEHGFKWLHVECVRFNHGSRQILFID